MRSKRVTAGRHGVRRGQGKAASGAGRQNGKGKGGNKRVGGSAEPGRKSTVTAKFWARFL